MLETLAGGRRRHCLSLVTDGRDPRRYGPGRHSAGIPVRAGRVCPLKSECSKPAPQPMIERCSGQCSPAAPSLGSTGKASEGSSLIVARLHLVRSAKGAPIPADCYTSQRDDKRRLLGAHQNALHGKLRSLFRESLPHHGGTDTSHSSIWHSTS